MSKPLRNPRQDQEALKAGIVHSLYEAGLAAYDAGEQTTIEQANEALAQLGARLLPDVPSDRVKTALYRHYNASGQLLYVGISLHAAMRFIGHKATADWLYQVSRIDVEWHCGRKQAEAAELKAIQTESPLHNIRGAKIRAVRNKRRARQDV